MVPRVPVSSLKFLEQILKPQLYTYDELIINLIIITFVKLR